MVIRVERIHHYLSEKTIAFIYFSIFLVNSCNGIFGDGLVYRVASYATKAIILILLLINYKSFADKHLLSRIGWILVGLFFFGLNYYITWSKEGFQTETLSFWGNVLPVLLLLSTIDQFDMLLKKLVNISKIIAAFSIVVLIFRRTGSYEYSMGLANSLVLPGICLMHDYFRNNKKGSAVGFVILAAVIVVMGSRGALLGLVAFFTLRMLKDLGNNRHRIRTIIIVFSILTIFLFYTRILELIQDILSGMGIYSRTIYILINLHGHLSGREEIYSQIINVIKANPFVVRGIGSSFSITGGAFAHNFILQLLCEGGVLFGGIITITIIWYSIKTIFLKSNSTVNELIFMVFSASIPRLVFSGSIWSSPELWCWIILIIFWRKKDGNCFFEYYSSNQKSIKIS